MSLIDLITGTTGNQAAEQVESNQGVSKSQVIALLAVAAPLIISYIMKKTKEEPQAAEAVSNALDRDHDGSILNDVSQVQNRQEEGSSILNHVLGDDRNNVENQLSQSTGISMDKIGPALSMLAPVIMGYLGQQKQQAGTGSSGITDLLGGILGNASSAANTSGDNPLADILGNVMGGSQGGNNPLSSILGSVLGGGNSSSGGIGGLLGNLFGKK